MKGINYKANMKIKKKKLILLILYYLGLALILAIGTTLARYTTNVNVNATVDVAKFNLQIQGVDLNQTIDLSNTVVDDGYGSNLVIPRFKRNYYT